MRRDRSGTPFDSLYGVAHWIMVLSGLLVIAITGYYVFGTLQANDQLFRAKLPDRYLTLEEFRGHAANIDLFTKILVAAALALGISAVIRFWEHAEAGLLVLALGAGLMFGMPWLIQNMGGQEGGLPKLFLQQFGNPRLVLVSKFTLAGMELMAVGGVHLLISFVQFLATFKARRPKANAEAAQTAASVRKANDRFLGPCWTLPFCRDTDKKLCPIRSAKKSCWRTGRGCYCDQQVVLTLSGGNTYSASRGAMGYQSRTAALASRPKTRREKREQCLGCPVYLHHQGQKYKLLTPLAIIAAIGAVGYFGQTFITQYPQIMAQFGRSFSGLSFSPTTAAPAWVAEHPEWVKAIGSPQGVPEWAANLANTQGVMWMIVGVVALMLIAYSVQSIEWILYRLGL